jgi:hypothetical protein
MRGAGASAARPPIAVATLIARVRNLMIVRMIDNFASIDISSLESLQRALQHVNSLMAFCRRGEAIPTSIGPYKLKFSAGPTTMLL